MYSFDFSIYILRIWQQKALKSKFYMDLYNFTMLEIQHVFVLP